MMRRLASGTPAFMLRSTGTVNITCRREGGGVTLSPEVLPLIQYDIPEAVSDSSTYITLGTLI